MCFLLLLYIVLTVCLLSMAMSLHLILEISATYRLVSYLLADKWLICRLRAQCMLSNNNINSGSLGLCACRCFLQNNVYCYIPWLSLNYTGTAIGWFLVTWPWLKSNVSRSWYIIACVAWRFCRAGRRSGVAAKFARSARERAAKPREK